MSGVPVVFLVGIFLAGEGHFAGIYDDHVVAVIDMRGKGGFVFAAQQVCDDGGQPADDEVLGIDQKSTFLSLPPAFGRRFSSRGLSYSVLRHGAKAFNRSSETKTAATRTAIRHAYRGRGQGNVKH